jgi:hypothetical protein
METGTEGALNPRGISRALADAALLPFLVGGAMYLVMLALGQKLLNDPDSYWHLIVGRWIISHEAVPFADPFSFTFAGKPWIAKEWLSQLLYVGAFDLGGWTGVVILAASAIALAYALLARFLERNLTPAAVLLLLAVAFLLAFRHSSARPHVLALPVMVALIGGLVRASDQERAPSLWLLPLMALWANLHGGFTLGLLLVGAIGLDAIVAAVPGERLGVAGRWIGFGLLALIAACITPYGPESILVTFRILGLGPALSIIEEWRPQNFGALAGFEVALLAAIGLALWRGFTLSLVRILILLGLLHLALSAQRNGEVLGLLAPLILARPLAVQFPQLRADPEEDSAGRPVILAGAVIVSLLILATVALSWVMAYAPNPRNTPAAAVDAVTAAGVGPVLNDYGFGGYLIHAGVPTFIDGRTELFGGDFVLRHHRAVTLADLPGLLRLLDEYKIGATLLAPETPAVAYLDRDGAWRRLYADDVAVVHVRR